MKNDQVTIVINVPRGQKELGGVPIEMVLERCLGEIGGALFRGVITDVAEVDVEGELRDGCNFTLACDETEVTS